MMMVLLAVPVGARAQTTAPAPAPTSEEQAPSTTTTTPPVAPPEAATSAPASDAKSASVEDPNKTKSAASAALLGPPSGLQLTLSWSLYSGVQTDDDLTNAYTSLAISTNYKLHPKVFIAASLSPYVELTKMPGDNRRADFFGGGSFVRLNFRNLYEVPGTGIKVGGAATYNLPVTYNDWFSGNKRLGALGGAVQAFRTFGELTVIGSMNANVPLFLHDRGYFQCDAAEVASMGAKCPPVEQTPVRNPRYAKGAGLTGIYNHDSISVFASVGVSQTTVRGPGAVAEAYQNVADLGQIDQRYSFSFISQVSYGLNDHHSVNVGLFNGGPQKTDRSSYNNVLFDPKFAGLFVGYDWVK
ncbi:MAG: hypothetical protein RL199_2221 [Pseudomonadota bacterium]|jgi:hypothetical protein